jgi:cell division protease FtsH
MTDNLRNFAVAMTAPLMLVTVATLLQNQTQRTNSEEISFSQWLNELEQGHAHGVLIQGPEIHGTSADGLSCGVFRVGAWA